MNTYEPFLTAAVKNALFAHMSEDEEIECCGVITLSDGEYAYEACENTHADPAKYFRFNAETRNRIITQEEIVAYAHSHPVGPGHPSKLDQEIQLKTGKPSVIAYRDISTGAVGVFSFGDHLLDAPLVGREFREAVFDCYEAIRSYAWQIEGRKMDAYPRHAGWWGREFQEDPEFVQDHDMYVRNFKDQGYVQFTPTLQGMQDEWTPQMGDLILLKLGAQVVNHAGVYVGNNRVYHHRLGRPSTETSIGYMLDKSLGTMWIRHESKLL